MPAGTGEKGEVQVGESSASPFSQSRLVSLFVVAMGILVSMSPDQLLGSAQSRGGAGVTQNSTTESTRKYGTLFHNASFWLGADGEISDRLLVSTDGVVLAMCVYCETISAFPFSLLPSAPTDAASRHTEHTNVHRRSDAAMNPEHEVDLGGAFVVPGLFDAHLHLVSGGRVHHAPLRRSADVRILVHAH